MYVLLKTGYSVAGGPLIFALKAAQRHMKPNITDFPGLKIPGSETSVLCSHRARTLETLLLRWCVTRVDPASSTLALH